MSRFDVGFRRGDDDNRAHCRPVVGCFETCEDCGEDPGSVEWVEIIDVEDVGAAKDCGAPCDEATQFSD
jgi:hypothetical protein